MVNFSIDGYQKQARTFPEWVWYEGTGDGGGTALEEGQAVCYNYDYGTDTAADGRRYNRVQNPTTANAQHFAGVTARAYSAQGANGRYIEIYNPGSVCNVLCGLNTDTVVGVGLLTFDVTAGFLGQFRYAGLPGAGSVQPLQTTTGDASDPGLCLAILQGGLQSGGVEVVPLVADAAMAAQMVGGTTLITGGSITTGNNTTTLADGTIPGLRKKYGIITTELTSYDVIITVTSGATDDVDDVSLDTITYANGSTCLNKYVTLSWDGAWMVQGRTEDVPALAGS